LQTETDNNENIVIQLLIF